MDADMSMGHILALSVTACVALDLKSSVATGASVLVNVLAIAQIWMSSSYGAALESELVWRRYPLVVLAVGIESLAAYTKGASEAIGTMACTAVVAILVMLDGRLGGWGHGCAHLVLLPTLAYRTDALLACIGA